MKPLTPWGLEVRKRLAERSMTMEDLARIIGASKGSIIGDMVYGYRPGKKYVDRIEKFLGMTSEKEVVNE